MSGSPPLPYVELPAQDHCGIQHDRLPASDCAVHNAADARGPVHPSCAEAPRLRARQIIDDPLVTLTLAAPNPGMDDRIVFIGDDDSGRALEIIAVDLPEYLLMIPAQDLQAKFRPHYDRAKEEE